MPIIIFKENHKKPLEREPYFTFNKKFEEEADVGIDRTRINIDIPSHKPGFTNGFDVNPFYGEDFLLSFSFMKNTLEDPDCYLIHHTVEFEFAEDFIELQRDSLEEVSKRAGFFYIDGADYYEFSYHLGENKAELRFDILASEKKIKRVCNQLISHDIAIFARGW